MKSMPCFSRLAADFVGLNSKSIRYRKYTRTTQPWGDASGPGYLLFSDWLNLEGLRGDGPVGPGGGGRARNGFRIDRIDITMKAS
jgi:hypothetical protein